MKKGKLTIMLLLILTTISLSACSGNDKVEITKKELTFLKKESVSNFTGTGYFLYFESPEDKKYYYVSVTGWGYDNFDSKEGDVIEFNYKEESSLNYGKIELFDEYKQLGVSDKSLLE